MAAAEAEEEAVLKARVDINMVEIPDQDTTVLVSAMARLIIRHDEQVLALSSDVSFVSFARTDQHSVLPQLFAESRRLKSALSALPPKAGAGYQVLS